MRGVSYGLRAEVGGSEVGTSGRVATVPAGYADGVPRNLGMVGGEVLIRGRRRPIVGMVTMDQLMVDVGDVPAELGDEVVLIGRQGDEEITADRVGASGSARSPTRSSPASAPASRAPMWVSRARRAWHPRR